MRYLMLRLNAPIMSFGDAASQYQNVRDTATNPTKSMVVGMIACAMGIDRNDSKVHLLSNELTIKTTTINKQATFWRDYQNAHLRDIDEHGHYGSKDDKNVQRWKTYIANGNYLIFIGSDDEDLLKRIHAALRRPQWPLFVGRKCCTLSARVVTENYQSYDEKAIQDVVIDFNNKMEDFVTLCTCQ